MMGQQTRSESLFYYFRIEDHVPEDHLLRLVGRYVDFTFVREALKASYSHTGRPSIDPEVLLRIVLIGYLYGVTSERRLVEDVAMHLAYRWFTGLGSDQEIPDHSTFSKNRHGRFQESPLFLDLFERVVQQCVEVGLLKGADLSVDSTQISADASPDRTITRDQLVEVAKVNRTVREYVEQIERENVMVQSAQTSEAAAEQQEGPKLFRTYRNSPPRQISTTDPDAALSSKRGASEFAYYDNYLIDNRSCIIAGVMATPARLSQEIIAARKMLERVKERFGLQPVSVTADKSYGTGEFLSWLSNRQMTPYIPVLDRKQQTKGFYTQHDFTRVPEENGYRCPAGHLLHYVGLSRGSQGFTYSAKPSQCRSCSHKPACTPSATRRTLRVNWYEDVREHVRNLSQTPEFAAARRTGNKIEAVFSELRNQIRLRRLRLCGLRHVKEQFFLAATVQM